MAVASSTRRPVVIAQTKEGPVSRGLDGVKGSPEFVVGEVFRRSFHTCAFGELAQDRWHLPRFFNVIGVGDRHMLGFGRGIHEQEIERQ